MTTQTLTLAGFLLARIEEDEAAAREVSNWDAHLTHEMSGFSANAMRFAGLMTPARVLAECAAKRRILFECSPAKLQDYDESAFSLAEVVLGHIAKPYASHADFRDEWRA